MTKKFFAALLLALVAFAGMYSHRKVELPEAALRFAPTTAIVYIYCDSFDGDYVQNGSGCIVKTELSRFKQTVSKAANVKGYSISFEGKSTDVEAIASLLSVKYLTYDSVPTVISLIGYSEALKGGVTADGQTVNVQIAYSNGVVSIGSPLILGSF